MAKNDKRIDLDLLLKRRGMTLEQYCEDRNVGTQEQFDALLRSENLRTTQSLQPKRAPLKEEKPVEHVTDSVEEDSLRKTAELVERTARRGRKTV